MFKWSQEREQQLKEAEQAELEAIKRANFLRKLKRDAYKTEDVAYTCTDSKYRSTF